MSDLNTFLKDRLTDSPMAAEWISLVAVANRANIGELVSTVQQEGYLCQTLGSDHIEKLGIREVLNIAEMFVSKGVVVLLFCSDAAQLHSITDEISRWKVKRKTEQYQKKGRFIIVSEMTTSQDFLPMTQEMVDYSVTIN